jgi:hypothetical protein
MVRLSVADHAEAHRLLYEEHGRWQDKLAWQSLAGKVGREEIIRTKLVEAARGNTNLLGYKHTPEGRVLCGKADKSYMQTEKYKKKMSKAMSKAMRGNQNARKKSP